MSSLSNARRGASRTEEDAKYQAYMSAYREGRNRVKAEQADSLSNARSSPLPSRSSGPSPGLRESSRSSLGGRGSPPAPP
mmetsp:Transcript_29083/g.71851  ORF Transcript_29083/g.71851 Transcript_29083/m.71851 type:complete len:80 (+) Transcript_29083:141-380(+)